jgi:hypothetical protein
MPVNSLEIAPGHRVSAHAVRNMRFVTTSITAAAAEVLACGSAVTLEPA